jgi:hypothetical protein
MLSFVLKKEQEYNELDFKIHPCDCRGLAYQNPKKIKFTDP